MQKARRFVCSTASESAASSTTARTAKKSRTSSAGGDSVAAQTLEAKTKPRSGKGGVRLLGGVSKSSRKAPKPSRPPRPNFGSLQNAVVLAPFYTLKRCYQNKLIDLYASEKMKKINQKLKMAKKQNLSFEYDIMELKPLTQVIKKESKTTKKQQGRSRSASYCQCEKVISREARTLRENASKQEKKPIGKESPPPSSPCFSGPSMGRAAKRRRLNPETLVPRDPKCEVARGTVLGGPRGNRRSSPRSSASKCESWESYSSPPSCKEEHLQGSLAISNTSFDSYFQHFEQSGWGCSEPVGKGDDARKPRQQVRVGATFLPKPVAKNLIGNVEGRSSDGEIADFMDREPQSRVIAAVEPNQNWQPLLRRRSRTKRKKPESESGAGYYLRSLSPAREEDFVGGSRTFLPANRQECRHACGLTASKSKSVQVEMGGQAEGAASEARDPGLCPSRSGRREAAPDGSWGDAPGEAAPEEALRDSRSAQRDSAGEPLAPPGGPAEDQEERCPGRKSVMALGALGGLGDPGEAPPRAELPGGLQERFPEPADSRQPGDSDFIFGARNNGGATLGDSCEFSFGLKWVFSDDED